MGCFVFTGGFPIRSNIVPFLPQPFSLLPVYKALSAGDRDTDLERIYGVYHNPAANQRKSLAPYSFASCGLF